MKTSEEKFGRQDFLDDRYLWNHIGNCKEFQIGKKWEAFKRMMERRKKNE